MRLPNHNRQLQTSPDAMHTVKDVVERVFSLLIGKANLDKIFASEVAMGRFNLDKENRKRKQGKGPEE